MTILPGETACLRCLMPEPPPPGTTPTCDTAGILAPIINVIASIAGQRGDQDPQRPSRGDQPRADGHRAVGQPRAAGQARPACARRADCPACQPPRVSLARRRARQPHGRALRPQRRAAHVPAAASRSRSTRWPPSWPASARSRATLPAAAGGRRLPAHGLPRRPSHHRRHRRHRHRPYRLCEVHRKLAPAIQLASKVGQAPACHAPAPTLTVLEWIGRREPALRLRLEWSG